MPPLKVQKSPQFAPRSQLSCSRLQDPAPGTLQSNTQLHPEKVLHCPPASHLAGSSGPWHHTGWGPSQPGVQPQPAGCSPSSGGHSHLPLRQSMAPGSQRGTKPPGQLTRAPPGPFPHPPREDPRKQRPCPTAPSSGAAKVGPARVGSWSTPSRSRAAQQSPCVPRHIGISPARAQGTPG